MKDHDFLPTAPLDHLRARSRVLRRLRDFFDQRGFFEVTTPLLSADTVVDRHIEPFRVTYFADPCRSNVGPTRYLQTSPEFHMKRLLAAGADAIYQVAQAFRAGEAGPLHNTEFTIVEWYRVGHDMTSGIELLSELIDALLNCGRAETFSYREVFQRHVGVDPLAAMDHELQRCAAQVSNAATRMDDRDDLLNWIFAEQVQPHLGTDCPAIVCDYPSSQAALARLRDSHPPVAERFELFHRGVELANGYHELLDPDELSQRMADVNCQRQRDGKPALPTKNRLKAAMMHGLPPCAGVALGFDRLVMLAVGAKSLAEVIPFPADNA